MIHSHGSALVRNYSDAYLSEIDEAGTNGAISTRGDAVLLRSRFDVRMDLAAIEIPDSEGLPYWPYWDWAEDPPVRYHNAALGLHADEHVSVGRGYWGGDNAEPVSLISGTGFAQWGSSQMLAMLGSGVTASAEFRPDPNFSRRYEVSWASAISVREPAMPWWGPDFAGQLGTDYLGLYFAPEGRWAMPFRWSLSAANADYVGGSPVRATAAAEGYLYSETARHRLGASQLAFSPGDWDVAAEAHAMIGDDRPGVDYDPHGVADILASVLRAYVPGVRVTVQRI